MRGSSDCYKSTAKFKLKQIQSGYETLLIVCMNGRYVALEDILITCVYFPLSHLRYDRRVHFDDIHDILLFNNDYYHIMSGNFIAYTAIFCDIIPVSEDKNFFLTEDICSILREAGVLVNICN